MKTFGVASAAAAAIAASSLFVGSVAAADIDPIVIKGAKFFHKGSGEQFFMKGVAYQQDYSANETVSKDDTTYTDPLSDGSKCKRDIPYLTKLSTNTIRVYALDPTKDHDDCMSALADAGIYVLADLAAPVYGSSINRDQPQWNEDLYNRYTSVIDAMKSYDNILGYFAGNEVANNASNTDAAAFVKAAVRDTKSYIKRQGYRTVGVGYASNDDGGIREDIANYLDCDSGDDSDSGVDFWGYNIYSWCGDSSYTESGYDQRTKEFSTYNVPAFFAEYGCNEVQPRPFTEVAALYGSKMTPVWSGGIVYMYFQETNDYGLVTISGDNVNTNDDFDNLSSQIAKVSPTGVKMGDYNPTNSAASCPTTGSDWNAKPSPLPPTPNKDTCACMMDTLSCTVSNDTDEDDYEDLFDTVCGYGDSCDGIAHNGSTAKYGPFGMCNAKQQLAYAFNAYYESQDSNPSACDFKSAATTTGGSKPSGSCSMLLAAASSGNPIQPSGSASASSGSGGSGGSGSSGSDSASSSGAAGINSVPSFETGLLPMAMVLVVGVVSGAGMILL